MAEIYHYRDHQKAVDRWSKPKRFKPKAVLPPIVRPVELIEADTYPSEITGLNYEHQGGDCA